MAEGVRYLRVRVVFRVFRMDESESETSGCKAEDFAFNSVEHIMRDVNNG